MNAAVSNVSNVSNVINTFSDWIWYLVPLVWFALFSAIIACVWIWAYMRYTRIDNSESRLWVFHTTFSVWANVVTAVGFIWMFKPTVQFIFEYGT